MPPRLHLSTFNARNGFICQSCRYFHMGGPLSSRSSRPPPSRMALPPELRQRLQRVRNEMKQEARRSGTPQRPVVLGRKEDPSTITSDPEESNDEFLAKFKERYKEELRQKVEEAEKEETDDDAPVVRYFEQDEKGVVTQLKDKTAFEHSMIDDEARRHLEDLEKKLQETDDLVKALSKLGAGQGAKQLRNKYRITEDQEDRKLPNIAAVSSAGLTQIQAKQVARFNSFFRSAVKKCQRNKVAFSYVQGTWGLYSLVRTALAGQRAVSTDKRPLWDNIPHEVWPWLWKILAADVDKNVNKMAHLHLLSRDMDAAGVQLDGPQQLLAIEATFIDGDQKAAIAKWRRGASTLGGEYSQLFKEYWELGCRMYSISGDLERAERVLDVLLKSSFETVPELFMPLVKTAANRGDEEAAWRGYQRIKEVFGDSLQLEDYDQIIGAFLSASMTEYAFHVFVDMMYSGAVTIKKDGKLPKKVSNSFFLGKWLKRLIGARDLDGALKVLKFLGDKGVMAAAIQVNGLIGAWLRSGDASDAEKADSLAWAMIESRRVYVDLRRREALLEWPVRLQWTARPKDGEDQALGFVPMATLETFSLLAENYNRRGLHAKLQNLWDALKDTEISSNEFMLNQLMSSFIEQGKGEEARQLYDTMVNENEVVPDHITFFQLYRSLAVNRVMAASISDEMRDEELVMSRRIFADLIATYWMFDRMSKEHMEGLSRSVLHTCRKTNDIIGLIVALHGLRTALGFELNETITTELISESTDLDRDTPWVRQRIMQASEIIDGTLQRIGQDSTVVALTKGEQLTAVLENYYRTRLNISDQDFKRLYDEVAQETGVYNLEPNRRLVG